MNESPLQSRQSWWASTAARTSAGAIASSGPESRRITSRNPGRACRAIRSHSVAPTAVAVGGGERPARQLDPGERERLGRERQRLGAHHLQRGPLGLPAVEQVQHHVGAEPGGADAEAGVAERVRRPAGVRRAEEREEPGAGVDGAAPLVAEPQPLELGEGLEELAGQQVERRRPVVEPAGDAAAEVVDRVVAAPQDPVVRRSAGSSGTGCRSRRCPAGAASRSRPAARPTAARSSARSRRPAPCASAPAARATGTRWCRARPAAPARCARTPSAPPAPSRPCRGPRHAVSSWIRTPSRSAASASPQASRAGSTRALSSRVQSPARYVGESTSARIASRSRYSPSPASTGLLAATPTWCGSVATDSEPVSSKSQSMP